MDGEGLELRNLCVRGASALCLSCPAFPACAATRTTPENTDHAHDLPSRHIDVAFVAYFILQAEDQHWFITQGIQARYIVPMHFLHTLLGADFEIMETYFPDAVVFRQELETWLMPQE